MTTSPSPLPGAAEGHELRIRRVLNVPRSLAFRVWTSADHLIRWWGPRDASGTDFTTPSCEVDFRVGGRYRICIRSPQGQDYWQRGTYREIVEPERLVFTFAWEEDGTSEPETLVRVTFEEAADDKTLLTFRQTGFASAASRDGHAGGWEECLDRLAAHLTAKARDVPERT